MTVPTLWTRERFEELLADHHELIRRANELEQHLHRISESAGAEEIAECQHSVGSLIELLRQVLYLHDQQVLPLIEPKVTGAVSQPVCPDPTCD